MAVPASKRARAMDEYVIQARIVLAETQHVMRIVYEAYTAAYAADVIYASTVEEQRLRLERIYAAYGRINALAGLVDLWIDQPPQAAAPHMDTDGRLPAGGSQQQQLVGAFVQTGQHQQLPQREPERRPQQQQREQPVRARARFPLENEKDERRVDGHSRRKPDEGEGDMVAHGTPHAKQEGNGNGGAGARDRPQAGRSAAETTPSWAGCPVGGGFERILHAPDHPQRRKNMGLNATQQRRRRQRRARTREDRRHDRLWLVSYREIVPTIYDGWKNAGGFPRP